MKKGLSFSVLLFALILAISSCTKDKTSLPNAVNCNGISSTYNTYNNNIYPNITSNYCSIPACHGFGATQGGVDMSTYAATVNAVKNQNVICAMKGTSCELMPKGGPALPDSLILQMECWQANGFPQ